MFLPVVIIAATFFISASLGSEESCYLTEEQEDECASVCYPIVKPLLRYFEKCQGWEAQISQSQKDFSNLEKRHWEVQRNHDKLIGEIDKKNTEIELLKNQINDQKKTSELEILINQLREEIERIRRIEMSGEVPQANQNKTHTEERTKENKNSNNETDNVEVKTGVSANQQDNSRNQTKSETQTKAIPDSCLRNQRENWVLQEIQIPGLDPWKVLCRSDEEIGAGWMSVYSKYGDIWFNRTYEEYATGFGDGTVLHTNFFIGLEKLHLLTNEGPYEMILFNNRYKCDNFVIGNRSQGYMVKHIGYCTGPLHPYMRLYQGTTFSTFDRDEDGHPDRNLAKELGYGWWFNYRLVQLYEEFTVARMLIRKKTKENKHRF